MPSRKISGKEAKNSKEFNEYILENLSLDEITGLIKGKGLYYRVQVEISFNGKRTILALSHLIWYLKNKVWPKDNSHIDHKDENPLNNKPDNLQELLVEEHNKKKYADNFGLNVHYRKQAKK